jgi:hypothetical protein
VGETAGPEWDCGFSASEVGNARVTPAVPRAMSSFVHEHLIAEDQLASFSDNRPKE